MNVLLFEDQDIVEPGRVRVADRRFVHAREILRANVGDELQVGALGGRLGRGRVTRLDSECLELDVALDRDPPPPHPAVLAVALPRPPSVRKILSQATALGVKRILFFASARVEKSYWQSSALRPESLREQLLLGLEQAGDTILPAIERERSFRRFASETLQSLASGAEILVAHPGHSLARIDEGKRCVLVLGPEGGFLDDEVTALRDAGARMVGLGPRILRIETAVVALLSRVTG